MRLAPTVATNRHPIPSKIRNPKLLIMLGEEIFGLAKPWCVDGYRECPSGRILGSRFPRLELVISALIRRSEYKLCCAQRISDKSVCGAWDRGAWPVPAGGQAHV